MTSYSTARSLSDQAFVVDLWPAATESFGLVEHFIVESGLDGERDFALWEAEDGSLRLLLKPWLMRQSYRRGFVDRIIERCGLDDARIRKPVVRGLNGRWTRLVLRSPVKIDESCSPDDLAHFASVTREAFHELVGGVGTARYVNTPLGPPEYGLWSTLLRLQHDFEFEQVHEAFDAVLTVSVNESMVQVAIRAFDKADLRTAAQHLSLGAERFISAPDALPTNYIIHRVDLACSVTPTTHLDEPRTPEVMG